MDDTEQSGNAPEPATTLAVIAPASTAMVVPAMVADLGEAAALRFIDFFTANIRNSHARRAYGRGVAEFLTWCETIKAGRRLRPCIRPVRAARLED